MKQNNSLDFDDIINFTIDILTENPDVLEYYSDRFKYVLVDEYQDTNKSQFTLITLLAARHGNITVVGDNDQGIYSFRGADISNILNFEKDFPGTKIIKLEQNYRSTKSILNAANAVIKNNSKKYEKSLWTEKEDGKLPEIHLCTDEYDEARYIVEQIEHLKREEYYKYSDFAVLYRMNSQSRAIEDILRRENIPYKIVGGLKFYERKEIKDAIAYLDYEKALELLDFMEELSDEVAEIYTIRADIYKLNGNTSLMKQELEKAYKLKPELKGNLMESGEA